MARRSTRQSSSSVLTGTPKRSHPGEATPSRQSKRAKLGSSTKSTPQKSQYFQGPEEQDGSPPSGEDLKEESGYEEDTSDAMTPSDVGSTEEDISSNDDSTRRRIRKPSKGKSTSNTRQIHQAKTLRSQDLETVLAPGTEIIIKKPKAREAGVIPYRDSTIHPNTLIFLQELKSNNHRQWFKMHDPDYRQSLRDWNTFVEALTEKIAEADETIPELPAKDLVFRIHRDVRFSKDPTPYKTHFSAAWSRTGRKGPYAAYYLQIQPGKCLVGAGVWQPEAEKLAALREAIDRKPHHIKRILNEESLRREILEIKGDDMSKTVKAFVNQPMNKESALKVKPKGYDKDHKDIELLRLRNFTVGRKLLDKDILGPKGLERVYGLIVCMVPFVTYLNSVLMPDDAVEDSSSDGEQDLVEESS